MGTAADMREMADTMDKIAGSMIRGYAGLSGRSEDDIAALMTAETWFDAQDALAAGFATRMAEPVRIAASFDIDRFRNAPPSLIEAVAETVAAPNGFEDDPDRTAEATPPAVPESDVGKDNITSGDITMPAEDPPAPLEQEPGVSDGNTRPLRPSESSVAGANSAQDANAIRAEAIAHARAVIDLCRLAGQPQMAGRFLEDDASLDEVRNRLLAAKAEATPDITAAHAQPGRAAATTNPWGEVIARTFKTKG
jgi:hypothetical protein